MCNHKTHISLIKNSHKTLSQLGHCHLELSDQVSQLHNTLGCFIVSQSAVTRQRRLGEQKRRHTQERSALQLTGCKVLCFSPKRRDDWGDPLSSEEDKMSGVQQRLKLKQTPIDTWSLKEHLTLASAVLKWVSFFNLSSRNQLWSIIYQYESGEISPKAKKRLMGRPSNITSINVPIKGWESPAK